MAISQSEFKHLVRNSVGGRKGLMNTDNAFLDTYICLIYRLILSIPKIILISIHSKIEPGIVKLYLGMSLALYVFTIQAETPPMFQ